MSLCLFNLQLLRQIKDVFDPKEILNPEKIFTKEKRRNQKNKGKLI